jgi:hypothetical protein
MAKIRPAGKKKKTATRPPGTIPCLILLGLGFLLLALLFYAVIKSGAPSS